MHPGSINYPYDEGLLHLPHMVQQCKQHVSEPSFGDEGAPDAAESDTAAALAGSNTLASANVHNSTHKQADGARLACGVVVVCRRGNDSPHIVQSLKEHGVASAVDLIGGLSAWSTQVDTSFPDY